MSNGKPALINPLVERDCARSADELGAAPEVAPLVVAVGVARGWFGVAVDPRGPHSERGRGRQVVLEAEGDVEDVLRRLADRLERLAEDLLAGLVGARVLGGDDVVEGDLQLLER